MPVQAREQSRLQLDQITGRHRQRRQVLYNALMATLSPGDEVIIPAPHWVSYPDIVLLAEGKPVIVECGQNHHFKLRPEMLKRRSRRRPEMADPELAFEPDRRSLQRRQVSQGLG